MARRTAPVEAAWKANDSRPRAGVAATAPDPRRLRAMRAAVVGVGALGEAVVRILGMAGVGRLLLVDPDRVEESNLSRSIFFREAGAVGLLKVEAAARAAERLFPETAVDARPVEIADLGLGEPAECDVIFGCLDSESARLELAYAATRLDKPVCDGGLAVPGAAIGRVSWFPGRETACFGCGLRHSRRRELLETFDSAAYGCSEPEAVASGRASTPTQAAIVAAMQIEIALRGGEEAWAFEMGADFRTREHRLPRAKLCPFHDAPGELIAAESDAEPLRGLFVRARAAAPRAIVLDWPMALRACCSDCGEPARTPRRVYRIRREGCASCGGAVEVAETLRRIEEGSAWADRCPAELGLPARHLYTVESLERPS